MRRGGWVRSVILSPVCFPKNKWTTKSSLSLSGCQRPWVRQDFYTHVSNLLRFCGAHQVQCNTEWILFSFMLSYLINMAINQSCFAAVYPGFWNFNLLGLQIRSVLSRGESGSLPTWTLQVLLSVYKTNLIPQQSFPFDFSLMHKLKLILSGDAAHWCSLSSSCVASELWKEPEAFKITSTLYFKIPILDYRTSSQTPKIMDERLWTLARATSLNQSTLRC